MLSYAKIFVKCQKLFRKLSIYSQRKHFFDFIGWWIFKVSKWNRRRFSLKGNRWCIGNGNGRLDKHQINICLININDLEYGRTKVWVHKNTHFNFSSDNLCPKSIFFLYFFFVFDLKPFINLLIFIIGPNSKNITFAKTQFKAGVGMNWNLVRTRYPSVPKNFYLAGTQYLSVPGIQKFEILMGIGQYPSTHGYQGTAHADPWFKAHFLMTDPRWILVKKISLITFIFLSSWSLWSINKLKTTTYDIRNLLKNFIYNSSLLPVKQIRKSVWHLTEFFTVR